MRLHFLSFLGLFHSVRKQTPAACQSATRGVRMSGPVLRDRPGGAHAPSRPAGDPCIVPVACTHTNKSNALQRKGGDRALFVGHTPDGQMVVAAHHYDAMNGLAITSDEIDAASTEDGTQLACRREVVTGSHYPQWFCRYKEDHERQADAGRQGGRDFLRGRG